ncbi:uncharacterized protein CTRU02_204261 [Colletotrichum truncatum]|uniref:Integral membrane protein n=1 Tax=Colletotrichum truncatum TaxID=5467 RepID=A0ACC3ZBJ4_COLTU|nr:uncharacterized protein CTRU02_10112 [Colletotrichum truncatum]KAF6787817.1 integral membrane protein [Colletotrichum truncatum]
MSDTTLRTTLAPLPEDHRVGLIILTTFSCLSFLSTTLLWLFITYKLVAERLAERARRRKRKQKAQQRNAAAAAAAGPQLPDLSLGIDAPCSGATGFDRILELDRLAASAQEQRNNGTVDREADDETEPEIRNPFPILVYNLLLADMMEALAYGLSFYWVAVNGIFAPSPVCWAQGWLGSTSNLAASLFLVVISVNTCLTVGLGYKPPPWVVYTCIAGLWVFDFAVNGAGIASSHLHPTAPGESFYMRANVWCWISNAYDPWRLWAHYFWVIVSILMTIILYSFVFITLWRQKRSCRHLPQKRSVSRSGHSEFSSEINQRPACPQPSGYHPAFLAYPFVYIACSTPLIIGRITSLLGTDLGTSYFAFAGSLLAANGLLNSILWTTTIVFSAPQDVHDAGLDRFAFMRTPIREFGNIVVISGPASRRVPLSEITPDSGRKHWWWWEHGGQRGWGRSYASTHRMPNESSIEVPAYELQNLVGGPHIQMDVVTAVRSDSVDYTVDK